MALLGAAAAALPFTARAQQSAMPVVGLLRTTPSAPFAHLVAAFRRGLSDAGFVEGQNVAIEQRWPKVRIIGYPLSLPIYCFGMSSGTGGGTLVGHSMFLFGSPGKDPARTFGCGLFS